MAMPDDSRTRAEPLRSDGGLDARPDRPALVGFISDGKSEEAVREGLSDLATEELDLRRGGIRAAIAAMQRKATPKVLIVDVSGEERPLSALGDLANAVEPDVCVLVVGEIDHVDFYREVTRSMGASEYLAKPLTRDAVARHFGGFLSGQVRTGQDVALGGRAVSITGVRGGVGATTIAVNLAWNLGVTMHRHTVLVDPDIHLGAAAFLLNVQPGLGLRMALEMPERIDALLAERAALPAAERLHILASEEKPSVVANHAPGAAVALIDALRRRYNFIIADVPFAPVPLYHDLLDLVDQRVLVMEPTLAAVRDTVRLLTLPKGPRQDQRAVIVLNRVGLPGGLTRRQVEEALKMKVDVAIPDQPRQVGNAATLGEAAMKTSVGMRTAIQELARQVAGVRMLDDGASTSSRRRGGRPERQGWLSSKRAARS
jgi:pilus assembly protein CpaE